MPVDKHFIGVPKIYYIQYIKLGGVTFVLVIIVNSSIINKTILFDPNVCLVVFYIFHVLTFV
ncbi:hypothetical protein Hdeb2414_s0001g00031491 [Helianthus debilis subsp. tardiflorus]